MSTFLFTEESLKVIKDALETLLPVDHEEMLTLLFRVKKYGGNRESDQERLNQLACLNLLPDKTTLKIWNTNFLRLPFLMQQLKGKVSRISRDLIVRWSALVVFVLRSNGFEVKVHGYVMLPFVLQSSIVCLGVCHLHLLRTIF